MVLVLKSEYGFCVKKLLLLQLLLLLLVGFIYLSAKSFAPNNYWDDIKSSGTIESNYCSLGGYAVAKKEYDAPNDESDRKTNHFVVWYPEEEGTYPLVVMVNGTGVPCQKYEAVFEHFASWGYVVIGNDYGTNWDGKHASETLDFALNTEEIRQMIDTEKIAIGGHSQGGMGTFNAITEYENGGKYKVAFSLSPPNDELAIALQWGFDLKSNHGYAFRLDQIQIPIMIAAGTGAFDNDIVSPISKMREEYANLKNDKVVFRRADKVDHGEILYEVNGYVIAWLDYYLKGADENKAAFFGENPEILSNERYQDFQSMECETENYAGEGGSSPRARH